MTRIVGGELFGVQSIPIKEIMQVFCIHFLSTLAPKVIFVGKQL